MSAIDPYANTAAVLDFAQLFERIFDKPDYSNKKHLIKAYKTLDEKMSINATNNPDGYWIRFNSRTFTEFNSPWVVEVVLPNGVVMEDMRRFDLISVFAINGTRYAKFSDGLIVKLSFKWEERFYEYYKERYQERHSK